MTYPALFESAEEGGFVVTFPDLGHGATQGETEAEATEMARDFLACVIADYGAEGKPLPAPGKYQGDRYRLVSAAKSAEVRAKKAGK